MAKRLLDKKGLITQKLTLTPVLHCVKKWCKKPSVAPCRQFLLAIRQLAGLMIFTPWNNKKNWMRCCQRPEMCAFINPVACQRWFAGNNGY